MIDSLCDIVCVPERLSRVKTITYLQRGPAQSVQATFLRVTTYPLIPTNWVLSKINLLLLLFFCSFFVLDFVLWYDVVGLGGRE